VKKPSVYRARFVRNGYVGTAAKRKVLVTRTIRSA
jgi:hypothetical protein